MRRQMRRDLKPRRPGCNSFRGQPHKEATIAENFKIPKKLTTVLVYMRPPLVFGGLLCAISVMWMRNPVIYTIGVSLLFISMSFDMVDGWFAARYQPNPNLAQLADRIMDKVVYSIIFPLIAVGAMWRLVVINPHYTKIELLHAIFILLICVTVLIRDNFANFMRSIAFRQGQEPEASELNRLRTMVAAPVGALLYAHVFYVSEGPPSQIYFWISWLGNLPLRGLFFIEIVFLIFNFGSIAAYCRKYGTYCLDDLCLGDQNLRRRILSFFPNSLTVMNAMMGILSVFFAYQGRIREAYFILIGAALFDKLDGSLARKLGLTEPIDPDGPARRINLGGILDDISDAISFCVVPAWIFHIYLDQIAEPGLYNLSLGLISVCYIILGISRLIYFTLDTSPIPGFFKGLPTPAAALLVVAPMTILEQSIYSQSDQILFWARFCIAVVIVASVTMNFYPIRYIHYGRFMNRHPFFVGVTFLVALILVFTPYFGYFALISMLIYLFSPLWTWRVTPDVAARETRL